jgi:hypothetical protein
VCGVPYFVVAGFFVLDEVLLQLAVRDGDARFDIELEHIPRVLLQGGFIKGNPN